MKVARVGEIMSRREPPMLKSFLSNSAIKIVLPKHVVIIIRIINLVRDSFKHGLGRKGLMRAQF